MSALWVLAPVGLVAACGLAAWWSSTGRTMDDLFAAPADPLPDPWQFTDEQVDDLFRDLTGRMMREYLTREGDAS